MPNKRPWPMLANRAQGLRAVGGSLEVAEGQLRFRPNAFDKVLGGESADIPLEQITRLGIEPGRASLKELFSGGLRSRLRVELGDGSVELFVVGRPAKAVEILQAELAG